LKMPFSTSKFEIWNCWKNFGIEFRNEKGFIHLPGRALHFWPISWSRPAPSRAPASALARALAPDQRQGLAAAWSYVVGAARPVAHGGPHCRATPPNRLSQAAAPHPRHFTSPPARSRARSTAAAHRHSST
jgi:hypothetical protein